MDGKLKLGELKTQANKRKLYLLLCCWQIMQACKQKCRGRGQSLHSANLTAQTPLDFLNTLPNFIQFVSLICLLHGAEWGNWCDCFLTAAIFGQCYLDWAYKEYSQHYIVFIMMLRFGPFINSVGYHHHTITANCQFVDGQLVGVTTRGPQEVYQKSKCLWERWNSIGKKNNLNELSK